MHLDEFLPRLEKVRGSSSRFTARCPAHDDRTPSLSVCGGDDGRILVSCKAGCETEDVVAAMGLTMADLFPNGGQPWHGMDSKRPLATYAYRDEKGGILFEVLRYPGKQFQQRMPDGKGGHIYRLNGVRRVLYGLPELLAAALGEPVFVVEGEKDVESLSRIGLVATTNPGGALKWRPEYSEYLRGRVVIIIPDNDASGRGHAKAVAASLTGIAASLRVLELPSLPEKGDVTDWLENGGAADDLKRLAQTAPQFEAGADIFPWPELQALPSALRTPPIFDALLLPEPLRPWVMDIAERAQIAPDYVAAGAVVALGSVIGRRCAIRPKRCDDWTVVPNLWGAAVGPPGVLKSPALQEALRPLERLAALAYKRYERERQGDRFRAIVAKAKEATIEQSIRKALKDGTDVAPLQTKLDQSGDEAAKLSRYIVNDSTVEKLGELLNENPNGLLVYRDELTGWLRMLEREGHEGDRAFYLEAWNGTGAFTYDRIARGTVRIEAACLSILGGIQPGPLASYLRSTIRGGIGDDGLMQRFQVVVYPDIPPDWHNVDRWPDSGAKARVFGLFERLDSLVVPYEQPDAPPEMPFIRFGDEAQETFDGWREKLEKRLRSSAEHPAFISHLAKYRSLMPSLALVFELVEVIANERPLGPVSRQSALRAAAWCDFLEEHARRVYQTVAESETTGARLLAERITSRKLCSPFSARDAYRSGWSGLASSEEVESALHMLEEANWVRRETEQTGGRPKTLFHVNPAVYQQCQEP